jgi:hypothetical protein
MLITACCKLLIMLFLACWFFHPDDGGTEFLQSVGPNKSHTALPFRPITFWRCDTKIILGSIRLWPEVTFSQPSEGTPRPLSKVTPWARILATIQCSVQSQFIMILLHCRPVHITAAADST